MFPLDQHIGVRIPGGSQIFLSIYAGLLEYLVSLRVATQLHVATVSPQRPLNPVARISWFLRLFVQLLRISRLLSQGSVSGDCPKYRTDWEGV